MRRAIFFFCFVAASCVLGPMVHSAAAAQDPKPEEMPVLDPQDEPCRAHNPHLASLETYARSLKDPAFIKNQKWAKVILPLTPEDDDVRQRTEAFSVVAIHYFDLRYAVIFCRTSEGRYSTEVGALLTMAWRDDHWICADAKCIRVYGKDISIGLEDAEYRKWWKADGPSNASRVGSKFILTTWEGGAVGDHISTTYQLNSKGRLVEYTRPFETAKRHRD